MPQCLMHGNYWSTWERQNESWWLCVITWKCIIVDGWNHPHHHGMGKKQIGHMDKCMANHNSIHSFNRMSIAIIYPIARIVKEEPCKGCPFWQPCPQLIFFISNHDKSIILTLSKIHLAQIFVIHCCNSLISHLTN
jgi:hypothetical protein